MRRRRRRHRYGDRGLHPPRRMGTEQHGGASGEPPGGSQCQERRTEDNVLGARPPGGAVGCDAKRIKPLWSDRDARDHNRQRAFSDLHRAWSDDAQRSHERWSTSVETRGELRHCLPPDRLHIPGQATGAASREPRESVAALFGSDGHVRQRRLRRPLDHVQEEAMSPSARIFGTEDSLMTVSLFARRLLAVVAMLVIALVLPARAEVEEKTTKAHGLTVHYKVVLPSGYDAAKTYPAIIALGGGPQTMNTVDGVLNRNLRIEAEKRGYIVIAPAAPDGELFFEDGDRIFPDFLKQ